MHTSFPRAGVFTVGGTNRAFHAEMDYKTPSLSGHGAGVEHG